MVTYIINLMDYFSKWPEKTNEQTQLLHFFIECFAGLSMLNYMYAHMYVCIKKLKALLLLTATNKPIIN